MDFERCSNCVNISIRKLCGDCKSRYKKLLIKKHRDNKKKTPVQTRLHVHQCEGTFKDLCKKCQRHYKTINKRNERIRKSLENANNVSSSPAITASPNPTPTQCSQRGCKRT